MFAVHGRDRAFTNWCSEQYDQEWSGMEEIDAYLGAQAIRENAEPIWFDGCLSGIRFKQEHHYTMFLLRYS